MTNGNETSETPAGQSSNRWAWVLGIAVLVTLGIWLLSRPGPVSETEFMPQRMVAGIEPLPIRVPPELKEADSIPESAGALAGGNLLLVTLDTTRADRIGCYGHADIETPAVDGLARRGVLFSQAIAPAPTTAASHASILTGLYPHRHSVRSNGVFRLPDEQRSLAEILGDNGYATAAMVSCFVLDDRFGFAQGFDRYDDEMAGGPDEGKEIAERRGDQTAARASHWLRQHADEPFFLWVHFFDPHAPYEPPYPYAGTYASVLYDGEIAFADAQLGVLLGLVQELGLAEKTLVIVAGDHGEGLGQHGERAHGYLLYDSTLHVPLVMSCGDRLGGGVHVSRRVSLVDIVPTALSLLGFKVPDGLDGIDLTAPRQDERVVFAETLHGMMAHGWAALFGAYQGSHKYIHGPDPELYDVAADPFEQEDLVGSSEQIAAGLKQRLAEVFGDELDEASPPEPTHEVSATDLAMLESLGYVGASSAGETAAPTARPDPKAVLPIKYRLDRVMEVATSDTALEPAVGELKQIIAEHPEFEPAYSSLGKCYRRMDRLDWAEAAYLKANELRPNMPHILLALAQIKTVQKQSEAAVAFYRQLVSVYPDHTQGHAELGAVLRGLGRLDEAVETLTKAFEAIPTDVNIREGLLQVFKALDRVDDAVAVLRQRLNKTPTLAPVRNSLARTLYSDKGDYAAAIALLREGLELSPDHPELVNNLGLILANCEDKQFRNPAEAVTLLERTCQATQYQQVEFVLTLGIAYDANGQLDYAIRTLEKALPIAQATGRERVADTIRRLLAQFQEKKGQGTTAAPASQPTP